MGWKPGQGVGPRLSKTEKKKRVKANKDGRKIYGCALPDSTPDSRVPDEDSSSSCDEESGTEEDISFAPDDYDPYIVKPKDNHFGIGYSGLDRRKVLSGHINLFDTAFTVQEKSKKFSITGQGFGVGALEDDDEDIYSRDDMSQYDFSLGSQESSKKKKNSKQFPAIVGPNDPIEGFTITQKIVRKKVFPPPQLPPGFQPVHSVKKSRFQPLQSKQGEVSSKSDYHRGDITAKERAIILDEPLPSSNISESIPTTLPESDESKAEIAKQVFGTTFKPFVAQPEKQRRYEQYLRLVKNGQKDKLSVLQPLSMTEWEREREKVEFEQAERLYKPLSVEFSDRFVTASQPDDSTNPLAEVQKTIDDQKDLKEAAKRKMFGKLTRKYFDWTPSSLLCKRFNIPEPNSGGSQSRPRQKLETKRPKFSVFNFLEATSHNSFSSQNKDEGNSSNCDVEVPTPIVKIEREDSVESDVITSSMAKDNEETIELMTKDPEDLTNKEDLYKAIFLSSSDESDDEETIVKDTQSKNNLTPSTSHEETTAASSRNVTLQKESLLLKNALRNTSPPRGIFANLDLDAINARRQQQSSSNKSDKSKLDTTVSKETVSKEVVDDVYGPKVPATIPVKKGTSISSSQKSDSSDSDEWVECDVSKHKSKKKQKKSRKEHKKYKSNHKHKKHKKYKR